MTQIHQTWEDRISSVVNLGEFIEWNETESFTSDLGRLEEALIEFSKENPKEALSCFEVLIGACLVKGDEVDDSDGYLGEFFDSIFQSWTRCCDQAKVSAPEFIRKLKHWMQVDDIGYCHDLEKTVIPALNSDYRLELQKSLECRLSHDGDETSSEEKMRNAEYERKSLLATLRKLFIFTHNRADLVQLGERYGFTQEDCLHLAGQTEIDGDLAGALDWTDRGLKIKTTDSFHVHELERLRRRLLIKTGKGEVALEDAWEKFKDSPSIYTFRDVLACAGDDIEKASLTQKAVPLFDQTDLRVALAAFFELKLTDQLIQRLDRAKEDDLKELFYGEVISMAKALSPQYPVQAARIYVAQALRILNEKRSKAYHHAHDYLWNAKLLYERTGKHKKWENIAERIQSEHRLKSSFIPGFKDILSGHNPNQHPSFMERIASKLDGNP